MVLDIGNPCPFPGVWTAESQNGARFIQGKEFSEYKAGTVYVIDFFNTG